MILLISLIISTYGISFLLIGLFLPQNDIIHMMPGVNSKIDKGIEIKNIDLLIKQYRALLKTVGFESIAAGILLYICKNHIDVVIIAYVLILFVVIGAFIFIMNRKNVHG